MGDINKTARINSLVAEVSALNAEIMGMNWENYSRIILDKNSQVYTEQDFSEKAQILYDLSQQLILIAREG